MVCDIRRFAKVLFVDIVEHYHFFRLVSADACQDDDIAKQSNWLEMLYLTLSFG